MSEADKCITAVREWFKKQNKPDEWVSQWWYQESPLLDGQAPYNLLVEERYDEVIGFARNDLVVLSKKQRPQQAAGVEKNS